MFDKKIILFFLLSVFYSKKILSWNDDYAPEKIFFERTVCLKKESSETKTRPIDSSESCLEGEKKYKLISGKNPKGSILMVPITTFPFFPLLKTSSSCDSESDHSLTQLICVSNIKKEILGVEITQSFYRGEIFIESSGVRSMGCDEISQKFLKACQEKWGGNEIKKECCF